RNREEHRRCSRLRARRSPRRIVPTGASLRLAGSGPGQPRTARGSPLAPPPPDLALDLAHGRGVLVVAEVDTATIRQPRALQPVPYVIPINRAVGVPAVGDLDGLLDDLVGDVGSGNDPGVLDAVVRVHSGCPFRSGVVDTPI